MNLRATVERYLKEGHTGEMHYISDELCLIENPSFAIIPNYPYRSPLVAAVYCKGGEGQGRVNATSYNITPGGFFIVLPGQITELIATNQDFSATYILMNEEFTNSLSIGNTFNLRNIITNTPYIQLDKRTQEALEGYLKMCRNLAINKQNPHCEEILQLLTRAYFLGLGYFIHQQNELNEQNDHSQRLCNEFIMLVETHYKEHRDLKYYADKMALTPKHISTTVKRASSKSATEWIEKYVTLDAITQLTSTNRSIKEIAYDLAFPSQSCFGKYFARVVGMSPSSYRSKHLK